MSERHLFWLRMSLLSPLVVLLLVYALHSGFRADIHEAVSHLVNGDLDALRAWAEQWGAWAPIATTVLMIVQAVIAPIPAVLVTATNSLLFGWVWGGILSIVAATLAAMLCYAIGRIFGDLIVGKLVSESSLKKSDDFMGRYGAPTILVARLIPIVPFDPISYLAGTARMPVWSFFWATLVGQIPAGMLYAYAASKLTEPGILLPTLIGGFLALLVLGFAAKRMLSSSATPSGTCPPKPTPGSDRPC